MGQMTIGRKQLLQKNILIVEELLRNNARSEFIHNERTENRLQRVSSHQISSHQTSSHQISFHQVKFPLLHQINRIQTDFTEAFD